ncbi:MAG: hypothetical protein JST79_12605 [Acidobacteria bacterium]|jgi:hypothetical protein|nr:hypothetical protein [Acidobacteriota bacterium]
MKGWKLDRIISIATLAVSLIALILVLKRPAPVAVVQTPAQAAANAQSFQDKLGQLAQSASTGSDPQAEAPADSPAAGSPSTPPLNRPEIRLSSGEVSAALAQAAGALTGADLTPNTDLGGGAPNIKDQQVSFDGDLVHGQFLTNIAGKDVWVTVSGHLGSKDGYATFDPTEFKVGDLNVPVSLVNDALQKKMAEQRDRLKLPEYVGGVKVENGELVLQQK